MPLPRPSRGALEAHWRRAAEALSLPREDLADVYRRSFGEPCGGLSMAQLMQRVLPVLSGIAAAREDPLEVAGATARARTRRGDDQRGARVATVRAYCGAADAGGEVAFPAAGLKVRPPKHAALLIIYKGKDLYMDHGKTRYGGCSVSAGADVVATTFVREAVSANEPWASFAAKGIN